MNWRKELAEIERALDQEQWESVAQRCGRLLEDLLRKLYNDALPKLSGEALEKVNQALKEIGKGQPVDRLGLGQLVALFWEADLVRQCKAVLGRDLRVLENRQLVQGWIDLRNRVAHAKGRVEEEEAQAFAVMLRNLLRSAGLIEPSKPLKRLPAWWEVVKPHRDVIEGRLDPGRFAARLDRVLAGQADPEYQNATEFFERTHLTPGLRELLRRALLRLSGRGGESLIHLETNFGGGKTHTLIALYHLFRSQEELVEQGWFQALLEEAGLEEVPKARVLAFVGTEPDPLKDWTPWGELAAQLGQYELVRESDQERMTPGKTQLRKLLGEGPVLILLDEIAEYLAKLVSPRTVLERERDAAEAYRTQVMAFLHELTETVGELPQAMLVVTTTTSTPYGEIGERVQMDLRQIVGRMHRLLEPVQSGDIYEVVRCRLFDDLGDPEVHDKVAEEFHKMYRDLGEEVPEEAGRVEYQKKLKRAYPFHPELIDVLYNQWGSFPGFQRTRGVLRLLAEVVAEEWRAHRPLPLIRLPDVPLAKDSVRQEFVKLIGQEYNSVLGCDIVGQRELARRIDAGQPEELRKLRLAEGLATAIFLSSFSGAQREERGITPQRLRLALLSPGIEATAVGDMLQKLESQLMYLHRRDNRYFFSTELNLNRAEAEAEEGVEEGAIGEEIHRFLERKLPRGKPFVDVHIWPKNPEDVPERRDGHMLVALSPEFLYGERAREFVAEMYRKAGNTIRAYPGAILALAPDKDELYALRAAVKKLLARREVKRSRARELGGEDQKTLERRIRESEAQTEEQVVRVWRHLALWGLGGEPEWIALAPYARASLTITAIVVEHLTSANRLSERIAPEKLIELTFQPDEEEKPYREVWEAFLRTPGMPVVPESAVREAIRDGVGKGVLGLRADDHVYFKQGCPDYLVAEAAVLRGEVAEGLVEKEALPAEAPEEKPGKEAVVTPAPGEPVTTSYRLRMKVPWDRLSDVFRGVVRPLRENVDEIELEVTINARRGKGLPKDVIDRTVKETLKQIDAKIIEEREE